ncbi:MAG: hypothetical protein ACK5YR_25380 [Pirellula sp.]|jgi:hypothetical protein
MAKFYVQSGILRGIVDCYDEQCAAVWVVQRTVTRATQAFENCGSKEKSLQEFIDEAIFELDEVIEINERGFSRNDSSTVDIHDAFCSWYQLTKVIESLSKAMEEKLDD